LIVFGC